VATLIRVFLLFFIAQLWGETHCYFIPPPGWDLADPSRLSSRVKIMFLGKSSKGLLPSVNLATEKINVSLNAYLTAVKKIHESDPNTRWRDLGTYKTSLGEGRLTEIETKISCGTARRMQLIVICDSTAYILTVGALKEEFPHHYKTFEAVLNSLRLISDITTSVSPQKQPRLSQLIHQLKEEFNVARATSTLDNTTLFQLPSFQKNSWEPFQQKIVTEFAEMGAYWQILLLQEIQTQVPEK
jgi:hypothetical protein